MPKTFTQLSQKERYDLLYALLAFIKAHPDFTAGKIRESFAKAYDLTDYTARRMIDFLWFSNVIYTSYVGFPPKAYYRLTDLGESIILRGLIRYEDFYLAPEWVKKALVRVKVIILQIRIAPFTFYLKEEWDYKVEVVTPADWIQDWQLDVWGKDYSVKHRTIILLQTLRIAPNYFTGYRWVRLTPEEIEARMRLGRILTVWRHMKFDPDDRVKVTKLSPTRWLVDFSNFSSILPDALDLEELRAIAEDLGYEAI